MRFPSEGGVGDALEQMPCRADLAVVFWQENVDEWHSGSDEN